MTKYHQRRVLEVFIFTSSSDGLSYVSFPIVISITWHTYHKVTFWYHLVLWEMLVAKLWLVTGNTATSKFLANRIVSELIPWTSQIKSSYMEIFLHYWSFGRGIHRSPVDSPHKGQWHGALIFLSAPEQTVEQTIETPMIWDAIVLNMASL